MPYTLIKEVLKSMDSAGNITVYCFICQSLLINILHFNCVFTAKSTDFSRYFR